MHRRRFVQHAAVATSIPAYGGLSLNATRAQTPASTSTTTLFGTAFDLIPEGEPNTVQVVTVGAPAGDSFRFVGRNGTDAPIELIGPDGTGHDAAGNAVATIVTGTIVPHRVEPGGIFIGFAIVDLEEIPDGTEFVFDLEYTADPVEPSYYTDLTVTAVEVSDTQVTGTLTNASAWPALSYGVNGLFFDSAGQITGSCIGLEFGPLAIGETVPFDAYVFGETNPDRFLFGAAGDIDWS